MSLLAIVPLNWLRLSDMLHQKSEIGLELAGIPGVLYSFIPDPPGTAETLETLTPWQQTLAQRLTGKLAWDEDRVGQIIT